MTLAVSEYSVPARVDDEFRDVVRVRNAVESHALGSDVVAMAAEELLTIYRDSPQRRCRLFSAHVDGELVGRSIVMLAVGGSAASGVVDVLPAHRGRGVGTALLERTEAAAVEAGRSHLQCHVAHRVDAGGDPVVPSTGFGALGGADPGVRFLRRHGYRLEQVDRISRLVVADADLARIDLDGQWRLHTWSGATPHRWLADLAALKTVMSTAAPSGSLVETPVLWSESDVTRRDADLAESGRGLLTAVVEHVASGRLVAITDLEVPVDPARPAVQEDTLVLPDHRGHRLGTVVKAANLASLRELSPQTAEVITYNAEENRPMLDVNEALGFRAIGHEGGWERSAT